MVRAVPVLVVMTMAVVDVNLPVALGAPMMPAPVLAATVDIPDMVALVASSVRLAPPVASTAVPMAAAEFAMAVAPPAPLLSALDPVLSTLATVTPVALPGPEP